MHGILMVIHCQMPRQLKKKNALPHFQLAGVCWNPLMQLFTTWGDGISLLGALPDETWLKYVGYVPGVMRNNKKVSHNSHWIAEPPSYSQAQELLHLVIHWVYILVSKYQE